MEEYLTQQNTDGPQKKALYNESKNPIEISEHVPDKHVGIWLKHQIDGKEHYIRDKAFIKEWRFWSRENLILPKTSKKRIILLGESVARGYFYDPHYTPSIVLEKIINSAQPINDVEVVDLARTSIGLPELSKVISSCFALKPDSIVIFAGNNWLSSLKDQVDQTKLYDDEGFLSVDSTFRLKDSLEKIFKVETKKYVETLSVLSKKHNVPIVFVVPEFNLLDWKSSPAERISPYLKGGKTDTWIDYVNQTKQAIQNEEFKEAEMLCGKIIELDRSHPIGYELLGECNLKTNRLDEARSILEFARDTTYFGRAVGQPRIYTAIQETLLTEAAQNDIELVDLKEIFHNYLDGLIPGRRFFLDYCHLTFEAIQIAMAFTAQTVIKCLTKKVIDINKLFKIAKSIAPSNDVAACAHLCASIHNAHWGQSEEIVEYHCKSAIEISPDLSSKFMIHYTSLINRKLSSELCKAYTELINSTVALQYEGGTGFLHKKSKKILDISLSNSMVKTLQQFDINIEENIENLRNKEHAISFQKTNLLQSFYSSFSYDSFLGKQSPHYQSKDVISEFCFINNDSSSVKLDLTYRTPRLKHADAFIELYINGIELIKLDSNKNWITSSFEIRADLIKKGVNWIMIKWPTNLEEVPAEKFHSTIDSVLNRLYPSWGEIHMFTLIKI